MASTNTATSSLSTFCSKSSSEHEVFISFRGETRHNFTDHLYGALDDRGIVTFKDDEEAESGEPIRTELENAIETSRVAVVVFSKDYASSSWCLEELAKIVERMKARRMKVFPVFYHVDPSDVRHQKGTFEVAFTKHEKLPEKDKQKVQRWRDALTDVANLVGYHLKDGSEREFIGSVVEKIMCYLYDTKDTIRVPWEKNLVGIDSSLQQMELYIDKASNDVRFIGVLGMKKIGKTSLALAVYARTHRQFEASSFVNDVKGRDIRVLYDELLWHLKLKTDRSNWTEDRAIDAIRMGLRNKRVLIVLDNVDREKLDKLVPCDWLGLGSRIIITAEDENLLLTRCKKENICKVEELNTNDSLQLFRRQVFSKIQCEKDVEDIWDDVQSYAGGHPFALIELGFYLSTKETHVWKEALKEFRTDPNNIIKETLCLSYNKLMPSQRELLLHIACFFNGADKDRIVDILTGVHSIRADHIHDLIKRSLIVTDFEGKLRMPNLLQVMGQQIVKERGTLSRIWDWEDLLEALENNMEMDSIEGIMLNSPPPQKVCLKADIFLRMRNLRLLKICGVLLPQGLNYIPKKLRLLEWDQFPSTSIPHNCQLEELVELNMRRSCFKEIPKEFCNFASLKLLDCSESQYLIKTPEFTGLPNLEEVIFEGCKRLFEVHESISAHSKLTRLNLKDCERLAIFPSEINMESLKTLLLSGSSRLQMFPAIGRDMTHLSELEGTGIEHVPLPFKHIFELRLENLQDCKVVSRVQVVNWNLKSIECLSKSLFRLQLHQGGRSLDLSFFNRLSKLFFRSYVRSRFQLDTGRPLIKYRGLAHNEESEMPRLMEPCVQEACEPPKMASSAQIVHSSSSFPSSSTFPSSYDVFISFCGIDTYNGFVEQLYAAFEQREFIVFKDDQKLERGKSIRKELLEAIKQSQYAVVVISENFAFSKWCLIELDKIVECETEDRLKIFPIFYHIDPSEVRDQQQIFAQAFGKHEQDPDVGEKQRRAWRTALGKVGNMAGWRVQPIISAEATVVEEITRRILRELQFNSSGFFRGLVGIGSRVKKLEEELCLGMDDVQLIGIHGMPGIGKTTLAEALFEKVSYKFEGSCFICCGDNKRIWKVYQQIADEILGERNLKIWNPVRGMELLKARLCNKKIFIVLDDVDHNQLEQLVGRADWFGEGSRIVVTSEDDQLLKPYVNKTYKVEPLGDKDALELFCQKAFKNSCPKPGYLDLVENIMRQVNGHPLAIIVIGLSLFGKGKGEWLGVRDAFELNSDDEILNKLENHYCMLRDSLRKHFLDKIVEYETEKRLKILPVFNRIDPSEVRKQKGIFAPVFDKNEEDPDVSEEQRRAWSTALGKVSNIAGWHVQPIVSTEATIVKQVTQRILCKVQSNSSKSFKGLVGIGSRVKKLEEELCLGMDDVRSIGIYGMPGIGKTTLAEALFKKVSYKFEGSCFICCGDNKRIWKVYQQIVDEILGERNLKIWNPVRGMELLKARLCNKKIFILDDVDHNQLEQLVGRADWFGEGSRIVVTSEDDQLLKPYVNKTYKVEPLGDKDALELFCQKAFKNSCPKPGYLDLVENIMRQVNGHPLAIIVIGLSLFGKGKEEWIGVHDVLEASSNDEIFNKLEISYSLLGDSLLKRYFLDEIVECETEKRLKILPIFHRVDPSEELLEKDGARFIGIYGMNGIGKTTLGTVIFESVRDEFDARYINPILSSSSTELSKISSVFDHPRRSFLLETVKKSVVRATLRILGR